MEEQRQPDNGTGHAEPSAWRVNGARRGTGGHPDHGWSSAGAALEPSAEPLALLTAGQSGSGGEARHRKYVPGLDDDTPAEGVPAVEPPLWREAARHSPSTEYDQLADYAANPVADLVDRRPADRPLAEYPEPPEPVERAGRAEPDEPGPARPAGPVAEGTALPQRVPAEPDVPPSGGPELGSGHALTESAGRESWTGDDLAWIADQLRRADVPGEAFTGTFDVDAVVAAVREVDGVREASVRTNPTGVHTLRLDLADDADPGQVSRAVARLLLERMGLSTAPQHVPQARAPQDGGSAPASAPPAPPEPAPGGGWEYEPTLAYEQVEPDDRLDYDGDSLPGGVWPGDEPAAAPARATRPLLGTQGGPRVLIDQVQVRTVGLEATVEVQLTADDRQASGSATGPSVDSYLVRLAAVAAAKAIDELLRGVAEPGGRSRCFVEHTGVVPFGTTEVAVVVVLLVCGGWVEQLTGSALVDGDPRQAVVRATLGAVNRRLEALLD